MQYQLKLRIKLLAGPSRVGVIKTTGNIDIYLPRVFHMRFVPNQSYLFGVYFTTFHLELKVRTSE